jgi:hypothetical protein
MDDLQELVQKTKVIKREKLWTLYKIWKFEEKGFTPSKKMSLNDSLADLKSELKQLEFKHYNEMFKRDELCLSKILKQIVENLEIIDKKVSSLSFNNK